MELDDELYRIGTVATLTGLSVERLRAWERRYGLAPAHKTGKTRYYSKPQVDRLQRMRELIDAGHPIGTLVGLDDGQLAARLAAASSPAPTAAAAEAARNWQPANDPGAATLSVGLVGAALETLAQGAGDQGTAMVAATFADVETLLAARPDPSINALVVHFPVLSIAQTEAIANAHPHAAVVPVYRFAQEPQVAELSDQGFTPLKWPLSWSAITRACQRNVVSDRRPPRAAPRRYGDSDLDSVAASHDDPHDCPAHVVELIHQLNAFADYSLECADAGMNAPRYERLHSDVTHVRARLEAALDSLIQNATPSERH